MIRNTRTTLLKLVRMNTLKLVIHTGTYVYHLAFLNSVLKLMIKDTWTDELNKEIVLVMKYMGCFRKKKVLTAVTSFTLYICTSLL